MGSGVTPYVGVWIETRDKSLGYSELTVTPYVGVWIETTLPPCIPSLPVVTPYVGVWIETPSKVAVIEYV